MGGRIMNDKGPHCELPERVTMGDRLGSSIEFAAETMIPRLGYESRSTAKENRTFSSSGGENALSVGSWFEMLSPDVSRWGSPSATEDRIAVTDPAYSRTQ
jgi:hypothetical protein